MPDPSQVAALKKLYEGGSAPGKSLLFAFDYGYFADMVYGRPDWDYKTTNLDEAAAASDKRFARILNATETDLQAFQERGGKLILYHGWSDAAISPLNSINYYESVVHEMGQQDADAFMRLYMVPGMQHCAGGPGTDVFGENGMSTADDPQHNMYIALERWEETGAPPSSIIASKTEGQGPATKVRMTRQLCAYPEIAKYKGSGNTNDAANFVCARP
jgi:Tannase and feruloyl esterase